METSNDPGKVTENPQSNNVLRDDYYSFALARLNESVN